MNKFKNFYSIQADNEITFPYWMMPSGKIIRVPHHYDDSFIREWLKPVKKEDVSNNTIDLILGKRGYVKIFSSPRKVFYKKYLPDFVFYLSPKQKESLLDFATKHKFINVDEPVRRERQIVAMGDNKEEIEYNPENLQKENTTVGISEPIEIDGVGSFLAKVDSGNDGHNVIHGTDLQRFKNHLGKIIVKFKTIDNKTVSFPQSGWIDVVAGGKTHSRPVVLMNIKVKGKFFENEPFSVADRSMNDEKVLLGVPFIKKMDAIIDVNKEGIVSEINSEEHENLIRIHNQNIESLIEKLKKEIKDTEDERDYDMEKRGVGGKVYNDKITRLHDQIKKLEDSKLVPTAIALSKLREIRKKINP